jgi:hypothetical protein
MSSLVDPSPSTVHANTILQDYEEEEQQNGGN